MDGLGAADEAGAGAAEVAGAAADVAGAAVVAAGGLVAVVAAGLDEVPEPQPTRISEKIRMIARTPKIAFLIDCPP